MYIYIYIPGARSERSARASAGQACEAALQHRLLLPSPIPRFVCTYKLNHTQTKPHT